MFLIYFEDVPERVKFSFSEDVWIRERRLEYSKGPKNAAPEYIRLDYN